MTARDLLQRRSTGDEKETLWQPTPLTVAAQAGRLCILDGIQRLPLGSITALLRLIEDRELTLFDGTRFVRPERYATMQTKLGLSEAELTARGIFRCHPDFRVLGACGYDRPCAHQYVGKSQSCMLENGRLIPHAS